MFDVQAARQEGYTDHEIATHLSTSRRFDLQGAMKEGYSYQEVIDHLSRATPVTSKPVETPDLEYREGRHYISIGGPKKTPPEAFPEVAIETLGGIPPFDIDKHMWGWASMRDREEEPPGDDVTMSLWPIVRPFLASGATSAGALTQGMAAMAAHFDLIDEWAARKSGGAIKSGLDWKAAAKRLERDSQFWRERAAEVGANALDEFIGDFVGGGIPGIAEFGFSLATGLTYPYALAAAKAEKEGRNEVVAGLTEAMKTGTLAMIFQMIHPLRQWLRAPAMGTVFGVQSATEQLAANGELSPGEIAKAVAAGAGYSLTSPGGRMGMNEVMEGLRGKSKSITERLERARQLTENGKFVLSSSETPDFGNIGADVSKAIGRPSAPIRLEKGNADFGEVHIELKHGKRIREAGYPDAVALVADVAANYDAIYEGKGTSLILSRKNGLNEIAFVQMVPAPGGNYYTVESALVSRPDYLKNKKLLWERAQSFHPPGGGTPSAISGQSSLSDKTVSEPKGGVKGEAEPEPIEVFPKETAENVKKRMGLFKEPRRQQGLIAWIRSKGGINEKDPSADVKAWRQKGSGYVGLISKKGRYLDELAQEWWWETGNKMETDQLAEMIGDHIMSTPKKGKGERSLDSMSDRDLENYIRRAESDWAKFKEQEAAERQAGRLSIFGKPPEVKAESFSFSFSNPEMEKRYQESIPKKASSVWKLKEGIKRAWRLMTREYEHLPKGAKFAELRFRLKELEKQKGVQAHHTAEEIAKEIAALNKTEYELFARKVVLNDLWTEMERGHELPWGFEPESLRAEMHRLNQAVEKANEKAISEGRGPVLQEAFDRRRNDWEKLRKEYIEAMASIDFDVEPLFQNERYFRHQVLNHIEMEGLFGAGQKLKTPAGRGFLKTREGSTLDINRDFLVPEELVKAQMRHDIEIAKTIRWIDDNMNIARALKRRAEAEGVKDWHTLIPGDMAAWQPREGNTFYMADTVPARMARDLHVGKLKKLGITEADLKPILAVGAKREEFVIPVEVADTLDNIVRTREKGAFAGIREATKYWKVWQLLSPRRAAKYNIRNLSGDMDATFVGNPRAFRRVPQAAKEIWNVFVEKKDMPPEMKEWFDRGGMESTLQAQEIEGLQDVWLFSRLYEKEGARLQDIPYRIWKKYWKAARMGTDMREALLRYANFLEYAEQMKQSPGGVPKNFGASIPEEILSLSNIYDRAYWLSNDLIGAYDRISVMGQNMRDYWFPFWSWKEINFKRYIQLARNAAYDKQFAEKVGRLALEKAEGGDVFKIRTQDLLELRKTMSASGKDVAAMAGKTGVSLITKTPLVAARVGKFVIVATAFQAATTAWNLTMFPEEEDELSEDEKGKPHIILGRDDDGKIISFNRLGALGDFLEWFGLDESHIYAKRWMNGEMTLEEIIVEMAKSPVNIFAQNVRPDVKTIGEIAQGRKIFPDVFSPTPIRERWRFIPACAGNTSGK